MDPKLNFRFDYNYLFFFAQIQTLLLLCSAFFKNKPYVLLSVCLIADLALIYYFKYHGPCTSQSLNNCAYRAFGFSACMNIAALYVIGDEGSEHEPTIFLFVYVGWVIWVIIWTIQARYFPDPSNEESEYEFLRNPKPEERINIAMTMRTEFAVRAFDIISDVIFFYEVVYLTESEKDEETGERAKSLSDWSPEGLFCTAIFATNCLHAASTFARVC
eukprot:g4409.t1